MRTPIDHLTPVERDALAYRWLLHEWFSSGGDDSFLQCTAASDSAELHAMITRDMLADPHLGGFVAAFSKASPRPAGTS